MRHLEEPTHLQTDPLQPRRDRQMVEWSSILGLGSRPSDLDRRIGEITKRFWPDGDVDLHGPNRDAGDEPIVERVRRVRSSDVHREVNVPSSVIVLRIRTESASAAATKG